MSKQHLRAAAEAFAGVSEIESACYHYTEHGHADVYRHTLAEHYKRELIRNHDSNNIGYYIAVVETALTEMTYPVLDGKSYAWTGRQRAAFAGIPRSTWADNNLSGHVNFIIDDIRAKSRYTLHLVEDNIRGRSAFA